MRALVTLVQKIEFRADDGKEVKLLKITYLSQDEGRPGYKGLPTITINSRHMQLFDQFPVVPSIYELDIAYESKKGLPNPVITGVQLLENLNLKELM